MLVVWLVVFTTFLVLSSPECEDPTRVGTAGLIRGEIDLLDVNVRNKRAIFSKPMNWSIERNPKPNRRLLSVRNSGHDNDNGRPSPPEPIHQDGIENLGNDHHHLDSFNTDVRKLSREQLQSNDGKSEITSEHSNSLLEQHNGGYQNVADLVIPGSSRILAELDISEIDDIDRENAIKLITRIENEQHLIQVERSKYLSQTYDLQEERSSLEAVSLGITQQRAVLRTGVETEDDSFRSQEEEIRSRHRELIRLRVVLQELRAEVRVLKKLVNILKDNDDALRAELESPALSSLIFKPGINHGASEASVISRTFASKAYSSIKGVENKALKLRIRVHPLVIAAIAVAVYGFLLVWVGSVGYLYFQFRERLTLAFASFVCDAIFSSFWMLTVGLSLVLQDDPLHVLEEQSPVAFLVFQLCSCILFVLFIFLDAICVLFDFSLLIVLELVVTGSIGHHFYFSVWEPALLENSFDSQSKLCYLLYGTVFATLFAVKVPIHAPLIVKRLHIVFRQVFGSISIDMKDDEVSIGPDSDIEAAGSPVEGVRTGMPSLSGADLGIPRPASVSTLATPSLLKVKAGAGMERAGSTRPMHPQGSTIGLSSCPGTMDTSSSGNVNDMSGMLHWRKVAGSPRNMLASASPKQMGPSSRGAAFWDNISSNEPVDSSLVRFRSPSTAPDYVEHSDRSSSMIYRAQDLVRRAASPVSNSGSSFVPFEEEAAVTNLSAPPAVRIPSSRAYQPLNLHLKSSLNGNAEQ